MSALTRYASSLHSMEQDLKIVKLNQGGQGKEFPQIVDLLRQLAELLSSSQPG